MKYLYYPGLIYYWALLTTTFLIGCLFLRKSFPLEYMLLVLLSGLTLLVESVVMTSLFLHTSRPWLYNFFAPVESGFIISIFYRAALQPLIKRLNAILLALLPVGTAILW